MLNRDLLIQYISRPDLLGTEDISLIAESLKKYPYCHVLHMAHLKSLHNSSCFSFPRELARAAIHIPDRAALFELINNTKGGYQNEQAKEQAVTSEQDAPRELGDWIKDQQSGASGIEGLIDKFIKTNPRIKPARETAGDDNYASAEKTDGELYEPHVESLMTETLARIYAEQKKYDRAIEAYRILMLKNPKTSSFFANRIEELKVLTDKTKN